MHFQQKHRCSLYDIIYFSSKLSYNSFYLYFTLYCGQYFPALIVLEFIEYKELSKCLLLYPLFLSLLFPPEIIALMCFIYLFLHVYLLDEMRRQCIFSWFVMVLQFRRLILVTLSREGVNWAIAHQIVSEMSLVTA